MSEENILQTLLSMGFEQDDCQKLLENGVTDIQEAIQCLILNKLPEKKNPEEINIIKNDIPQRNAELRAAYHEQLKRRKLEERKVKDEILNGFKSDRMTMKDKMQVRNDAVVRNDDLASTSTSTIGKSKPSTTLSRIQVRLPGGSAIQLSCQKNDQLQSVLDSILKSVEDQSLPYILIQPFPRKVFTPEDMQMNLCQLGLFPSASLVLSVPGPVDETDVDTEMVAAVIANDNIEDDGPSAVCTDSRLLQGNIANEINDAEPQDITSKREYVLSRKINTLKELSALHVAIQLTRAETQIINSMSILSSNAATQVLDVLKSRKLLSPKLMSAFLPCRLKEISFDSYGLATNELLEKLRFHTCVSSLSLRSCAILNDFGVIDCLKCLHNIRFLNLADCCRVTGKVLKYVKNLPHLEVLILDKLKINNEDMKGYFEGTQLCLKKLSLDFCSIDSNAFPLNHLCENLLSLSLNNTRISNLTFLQTFPNLVKLKVQNTLITDDELVHVKSLNKLNTFKFSGTNISDFGLSHLHGLHLIMIDTANRQTVTDETIALMKDFPLRNLNLSDHIYLTDSCIPSIACMVSLTNLSLSNTKIGDGNLMFLKDLQNLDELDLSKTFVTNHVALLLKDLRTLSTINLAWTGIDDSIISDLNSCLQIFKLNLSHCGITDKGIVKLKLDRLSVLLLDSTEVTWNGARVCVANCPNLSVLRNSSHHVLINNN